MSQIEPFILSSDSPFLKWFLPPLDCLTTLQKGFPKSLDLTGSLFLGLLRVSTLIFQFFLFLLCFGAGVAGNHQAIAAVATICPG